VTYEMMEAAWQPFAQTGASLIGWNPASNHTLPEAPLRADRLRLWRRVFG